MTGVVGLLIAFSYEHPALDHQSVCLFSQIQLYLYFSHKVHDFQGKISAILPICIMKKSNLEFRVKGIVSVIGTCANVYQIL